MSIAVETDSYAIFKKIFSFNLDAKSSAEHIGKLRSRTRSLSSFCDRGCGARSFEGVSSS